MVRTGEIKATRMELLNTRSKIKLAQKGHDLLKEKMDALVMELYAIKDEVYEAKKRLENELSDAYRALTKAEMILGPDRIRDLAQYAPAALSIETRTISIMGVRSPRFIIREEASEDESVFYGLTSSSAQLDKSIKLFRKALRTLMILAEKMTLLEKIAIEINKTKRRVNALNHILIPELKAKADFIASSLEEQERETFTRLKRVKAILEQKKQ